MMTRAVAHSFRPAFVHPAALVAETARVGDGTRIWAHAQVREDAVVGVECNIGKGVYIGAAVVVGARCKIENNASVFEGTTLEDGVFVGPHAVFANDEVPRATDPHGQLKGPEDWTRLGSTVRSGASVGAGAIVLPGIEIGRHAMVGAGSVVTKDVAAHALVVGNPARVIAWLCICGRRREREFRPDSDGSMRCDECPPSPRMPRS